MKNHSLTILWTIIICGSTFLIANKYLGENTNVSDISKENIVHNITETKESDSFSHNENEIIEEITLEDSKSFAEHIKEGDRLMTTFYYNSAIKEYKTALEKNPKSSEANKRLAFAYLKNNEPKLAEEYYRNALLLSPESNDIKLGLAKSLLNQNKKEEAKILIWEFPSEYLPGRYYQAVSKIIYEKYEDAEKIFKELLQTENLSAEYKEKSEIFYKAIENAKLIDDDPLYSKLLYLYALSSSGETASAIPLLFSLVNEKSNYRDAWIVLGYSFLNTGKINEAIDSLLKARDLDSNKAETNFYLSLAYFANNEYEKSLYYIQKAKSLNFKDKKILELKMAEIYNARSDYSNAEKQYETLLNQGNTEIEIYENIINLNLDKLDNTKKAYSYAEKLYEQHQNNPLTYILISKIYIKTKNIDAAKKFINYAMALNKSIPEIYLVLGKISEAEGQSILAKEYYTTAYSLGYNTSIAQKASERLNLINASLSGLNYQVNLLKQ